MLHYDFYSIQMIQNLIFEPHIPHFILNLFNLLITKMGSINSSILSFIIKSANVIKNINY